jgi:hypothetical protein
MKKLHKDPLFHFLVAGGLLFGAYAWLNPDTPENSPRTVQVTENEVALLKELWVRQWQRQPGESEVKGSCRLTPADDLFTHY